jgi:hypothetical protein
VDFNCSPSLRYLDQAPVFNHEREFTRAFYEDGGKEGERKSRDKYTREQCGGSETMKSLLGESE